MNKRLWIDYSKVRSALDFGNVLNHYQVEYPADRNQVKVLCPFHDEKTPSLSINLEDGKFQCFGCGEKGNTLEFIVRMEGKNPDDKDDLYTGAEIAIAIMGRSPEEFTKRGTPQKAQKTPLEAPKPAKRPLSRPEPLEAHSDDPSEPQEVSKAQTTPVLDLKLPLNSEPPFLADRGITPALASAVKPRHAAAMSVTASAVACFDKQHTTRLGAHKSVGALVKGLASAIG